MVSNNEMAGNTLDAKGTNCIIYLRLRKLFFNFHISSISIMSSLF